MTFLDFEIDEKDLAAAKFIGDTRRALVNALLEAKKENPSMCQAELARRINMDKGALSRLLNGHGNMTLRTIGEISWALGRNPNLILEETGKEGRASNSTKRATTVGRFTEHASWSVAVRKVSDVTVEHIVQKLRLSDASQ